MLNYLLYAEKIDEKNLGKEFEEIFGTKGERFMKTIMGSWLKEGLQKGKELGLVEGRELGLAEGKELGLVEGKELGKEFGLRMGKIETILSIIDRKFGKKSDNVKEKIEKLSAADLDKLSLALFDLETPDQLDEWLKLPCK
jgi:predicted transposase YdaD